MHSHKLLLLLLPILEVCWGCLPSRSSSTKDFPSTPPTRPPSNTVEFILQHRNQMLFQGVPLNTGHSEPPSPDHLTSAVGCPSSYKGYPWVTYKGRCYLAGFRGPCPPHMKMFLIQGTTQGVCDCECFNKNSPLTQTHCHLASHFVHIANVDGICHPLFTKGPCPAGHWLIIGADGRPQCQRRLCPVSPLTLKVVHYYSFYDEVTSHCAVNQGKCSPFHFYETDADNWIPVCKGVMKIGPTQPTPKPCHQDYVLSQCLGKFDSVRKTEKNRTRLNCINY